MKKYIFAILALSGCIIACENKDTKDETKTAGTTTSTVTMPYKASYTTEFTNNISDSDLLAALNSYKYWETGDMKGLRSTLGDSVTALFSGGEKFRGSSDSFVVISSSYRDSISTTSINMITWLKNYAATDSSNWVNVWYKEIDTYKNGKVDSAEYEDDNLVKNGKVIYFSSHRQTLK